MIMLVNLIVTAALVFILVFLLASIYAHLERRDYEE
jgi:hypothetical protein